MTKIFAKSRITHHSLAELCSETLRGRRARCNWQKITNLPSLYTMYAVSINFVAWRISRSARNGHVQYPVTPLNTQLGITPFWIKIADFSSVARACSVRYLWIASLVSILSRFGRLVENRSLQEHFTRSLLWKFWIVYAMDTERNCSLEISRSKSWLNGTC